MNFGDMSPLNLNIRDHLKAKPITEFPDAPDIESSNWGYVRRFATPLGQWLLRHQIDATRGAITRYCSAEKGLTVLDVGGGHAQNIELINDLGHTITIVGSNDICSELLTEYLTAGRAKFDVAPLTQLPYENNSFDVVICYRILSHMDSWEILIKELSRVAKQLVLVDYPSKKSLNFASDALFMLKKKVEKNTRPYKCFWDKEIDSAFARFYLTRIYRERQFFLPMAFYRLIGNVTVSKGIAKINKTLGLTSAFGSPVIVGFSPKKASKIGV